MLNWDTLRRCRSNHTTQSIFGLFKFNECFVDSMEIKWCAFIDLNQLKLAGKIDENELQTVIC